mmetsp:Transcript_18140/g.36716  ORF Transcript_18140/g.36716 Transcript_18140/m.36716 type:complete len:264 (+) Transcript_18140:1388-2179(+)
MSRPMSMPGGKCMPIGSIPGWKPGIPGNGGGRKCVPAIADGPNLPAAMGIPPIRKGSRPCGSGSGMMSWWASTSSRMSLASTCGWWCPSRYADTLFRSAALPWRSRCLASSTTVKRSMPSGLSSVPAAIGCSCSGSLSPFFFPLARAAGASVAARAATRAASLRRRSISSLRREAYRVICSCSSSVGGAEGLTVRMRRRLGLAGASSATSSFATGSSVSLLTEPMSSSPTGSPGPPIWVGAGAAQLGSSCRVRAMPGMPERSG